MFCRTELKVVGSSVDVIMSLDIYGLWFNWADFIFLRCVSGIRYMETRTLYFTWHRCLQIMSL